LKKWFAWIMTLAMVLGLAACGQQVESPAETPPKTEGDLLREQILNGPPPPDERKQEGHTIYFAGGCFWGVEKYMEAIPGVVDVVTGYANGTWELGRALTYGDVRTGNTGFRETVEVEYDPEQVSLDALLFSFFYLIDPTVENQQGPDIGSEYQTGVYYVNESDRETIDRIAAIERTRYPAFVVELEPLEIFYRAEEEHQDYLAKNPDGYCHVAQGQINWASQMIVDPADYPRPDDDTIREMLTEEQYAVTQENETEVAFENEYWDFFEKGIYVDVVSGEPLFSSRDKYDCGSGWPSFSRGIDINTFFFTVDNSLGMERIEVRSRSANSHLGHMFQNDPDSPTSQRYCMNSAALRFIPYEEMDAAGYGYLKPMVDEAAPNGYRSITAEEAKTFMDENPDAVILDVRESAEYAEGHIPGAVMLPVGYISQTNAANAIPSLETPVLVYCRSGNRSKIASELLAELGYLEVLEFGGIQDWPYDIVTE
jgi:peptide methionine sulfoxide reductase msrA/msrB